MSEEQKVDAALKYADNNHLDYQEGHDTYDDIYDAFLGGIDYALSHQWISVEERLPGKSRGLYELEEDEQHKHVLFRTRNGLTFSGYLDAEEIWRDERTLPVNYITPSPVTHWMPIPELKGGNR